jgi:hypothetical protein
MALQTKIVLGATPKDDQLFITGDPKLLAILLGFCDISTVVSPKLKDQQAQFEYFTGKFSARTVVFNIGNPKFPKDSFIELLKTSEVIKL